jgi:hypothetical protein
LEDPEAWYAALDVARNGKVSCSEVVDALHATLRVKSQWLQQNFGFPGKYNSTISARECEALLLDIDQKFTASAKASKSKVPNVQQRHAWFDHWDVNGAGLLTQEEVTRALLKTLREFDALTIHDAVASLWPQVDEFNSGLVDSEAVLVPGSGLLDRVVKYASGNAVGARRKFRVAVLGVAACKPRSRDAKISAHRVASCPAKHMPSENAEPPLLE